MPTELILTLVRMAKDDIRQAKSRQAIWLELTNKWKESYLGAEFTKLYNQENDIVKGALTELKQLYREANSEEQLTIHNRQNQPD